MTPLFKKGSFPDISLQTNFLYELHKQRVCVTNFIYLLEVEVSEADFTDSKVFLSNFFKTDNCIFIF